MFASVSSELATSFTTVALTVILPKPCVSATVRVPSAAIAVPSAILSTPPSVAGAIDHTIVASLIAVVFSASAYATAVYLPVFPICTSVFVLEITTLSTSALANSAVTAILSSVPRTVYVY